MTDRLQALIELRERVKEKVDDYHLHAAAFPSESAYGHCTWHDSHKAANGSLDAALSLHNAVLPGWDWMIASEESGAVVEVAHEFSDDEGDHYCGCAGEGLQCHPARAWLIAILTALIAMEGAEDDAVGGLRDARGEG